MISLSDIVKIPNTELFRYYKYRSFMKDDITFPESKHIYWSDLHAMPDHERKIKIEDNNIADIFLSSCYMSFGDYDNSCMVERTNKKVFLEMFNESPIVYEATGGYGSESVVLSLREMLNPENEEVAQQIIDTLNALSDYPCIDDEDMSNMEYDAFHDALQDYGIEDTMRALSKKYGITVYDYNHEKLEGMILDIDGNGNPVFMIESGESCYIDIDDMIVPKISRDMFISTLIDYEVVQE